MNLIFYSQSEYIHLPYNLKLFDQYYSSSSTEHTHSNINTVALRSSLMNALGSQFDWVYFSPLPLSHSYSPHPQSKKLLNQQSHKLHTDLLVSMSVTPNFAVMATPSLETNDLKTIDAEIGSEEISSAVAIVTVVLINVGFCGLILCQ